MVTRTCPSSAEKKFQRVWIFWIFHCNLWLATIWRKPTAKNNRKEYNCTKACFSWRWQSLRVSFSRAPYHTCCDNNSLAATEYLKRIICDDSICLCIEDCLYTSVLANLACHILQAQKEGSEHVTSRMGVQSKVQKRLPGAKATIFLDSLEDFRYDFKLDSNLERLRCKRTLCMDYPTCSRIHSLSLSIRP